VFLNPTIQVIFRQFFGPSQGKLMEVLDRRTSKSTALIAISCKDYTYSCYNL